MPLPPPSLEHALPVPFFKNNHTAIFHWFQIFESLPRNTMFILVTGQGDTCEVRRVQVCAPVFVGGASSAR